MQDISYRKVGSVNPLPHESHKSISVKNPTPQLTQTIERFIGYASVMGSWLTNVISKQKTQRLLHKSHLEVYVEPKVVPKKLGDHAKTAVTKVINTAHEKASTAKKAVKSPLGKVTVVQTAALLALFVYVAHGLPIKQVGNPITTTTARNVGQGSTETLHQFLPTAQDYIQPQPFQESTVKQTNKLPLLAWATPWDLDSLATNISSYSSISAFWLTLNSDGVTFQSKADWSQWQAFVTKYKQPNQKYYLTVSGQPNDVLAGIIDPTNRAAQISNLLQIVQQQGFDGVDIDYEALGASNRDLFTNFIGDLTQAFHSQNKLVSVTVETAVTPDQAPMDWQALSSVADQIRVMAYDYHSSLTGEPGPIAPLGWIQDIMNYAASTIAPSKLVIGLGNYGYDWQKPDPSSSNQSWQGSAVSFEQATALAQSKTISITRASGIDDRGYDIGSIPNFTYQDDQGNQHEVWFEDAASLEAKVNLVSQYQTQGVIFWSVGLGDTQFWQQNTPSPSVSSTNGTIN